MKTHILVILVLLTKLCLAQVHTGAEQLDKYLPLLEEKRVALLVNQTSVIGKEHIVDVLLRHGVNITCIFAPEHGFSGQVAAGLTFENSFDKERNIPIYSLYNKSGLGRPTREVTEKFDIIICDLQDVGVRFYSYYISMVKIMNSCSVNKKQMIILDRPNPNGHYVAGPILEPKHFSGVGYLPIPVVYGMTLGELALMVNGERWLPQGRQCPLLVIPCSGYTHQTIYNLPVSPSPSLQNMKAVYLYPSLCFFEATPVSIGRGTDSPFLVYGHPDMKGYTFAFIPHQNNYTPNPPCKDQLCYGDDFSTISIEEARNTKLTLKYIIDAYHNLNIGDKFFSNYFELLIGTDYVRKMIENGASDEDIKATWNDNVETFKKQQRPYMLYP